MSELSLQQLLDTGISLEDILFNKEPVQVDVSVNTDSLAAVLQKERNQSLEILNELRATLIKNNEINKELLIKALSLVIKNSSITKSTGLKEITGLKMIREPQTKLLDKVKLIRG